MGRETQGVDWNGEEGQSLRFGQLCKIIIRSSGEFSPNDLGCGYGALVDFFENRYHGFTYSGFDVSESMIREARQRYLDISRARFIVSAHRTRLPTTG